MLSSDMIKSVLITVGYPDTLEKDLEYSSEILTRTVARLKKKEPRADMQAAPTKIEDKGRQLKSTLVIKAVNDLTNSYDGVIDSNSPSY